jgi:GT2 family glycosyltransferase
MVMDNEKIVTIQNTGKSNGGQKPPAQSVSVLAPPGLVSIIIPCCGMLEYTKICVPSILRHTREPYELIFVDIGSLDGTAEYLAGLSASARLRIEVVRAATDLDISAACKEAIRLARGEHLVLLNNDTVVTDGWLSQLVALVGASAAIGMVGPMSNYAAPPQLVETVPYRIGPQKRIAAAKGRTDDMLVDAAAVNDFARKFREEQRGKWIDVERLGGFCMLLKRQVLKKIEQFGSLDEWSGLGLFDTDILSSKARQAGFTLACCRDLFVHHFGTRAFAHGAPKIEPARVTG